MRTYSLPHTHTRTDTHGRPELDYHAFCQCACEDSGNFYDFIPQDVGRLAVSFGDLPSTEAPSINISCLRALVRGLAHGDLSAFARELNATLYLLGPHTPWFYARIDSVRHELQYVNAGHEAPLLIRKNGMVRRLERTGAELGLSTRGLHRRETTAFEPGDLLAIFSEAVSEHTVRQTVLDYPQAGVAELARRVMESGATPSMVEDRTFAAIRAVDACRHPLPQAQEEELAMCAA
jgi:sigma-B regulation protein RsbU (phosphoserine phosphatase)